VGTINIGHLFDAWVLTL